MVEKLNLSLEYCIGGKLQQISVKIFGYITSECSVWTWHFTLTGAQVSLLLGPALMGGLNK